MPVLQIESWSDDVAWASVNGWNLEAFVQRLSLCSTLRGTELKRLARAIRKREIEQIEVTSVEAAGALIHTLESLGATIRLNN
ncbi:hypothetical protein FBY21_4928 [Pseudomonas sp. SLBN-26]|uniref:hypothetical protein n=1 Tax=Pseudomonadaceae TaxID=135621 RepID=UPI001153AB30|nr:MULTISPECIES: hypothetical protein [Pseudomonas]MCP1620278.1 hypothetical protein [Pseudomonas otitidis]TQL09493.1 hypothetical protein FBY21_4928 [Pseudomonas sp. SLBN-26]GJN48282.1 hypothetical protein TUM20249_42680 [Pseudomonas tohonis]